MNTDRHRWELLENVLRRGEHMFTEWKMTESWQDRIIKAKSCGPVMGLSAIILFLLCMILSRHDSVFFHLVAASLRQAFASWRLCAARVEILSRQRGNLLEQLLTEK